MTEWHDMRFLVENKRDLPDTEVKLDKECKILGFLIILSAFIWWMTIMGV